MVRAVAHARGVTVDLRPLQERVARIGADITIHIAVPRFDQSTARATLELMDMLLTGSSHVQAQYAEDGSLPGVTIYLERSGRRGPITFMGTPSGYELEALVHALECWSRPDQTPFQTSYRQLLGEIAEDLRSDLFVAPT